VGGNFAGLAALWQLLSWQRTRTRSRTNHYDDDDDDVRIVLIDRNDYSEYTPGILRLFCEPGYFFRLAQALPETNQEECFQRIQGTVTSIVSEEDDNNNNSDNDNDSDNNNDNDGIPNTTTTYANNPTRTMTARNSEQNANKILTYIPANANANASTTKTLRYDYLILATGATYSAPISPAAVNATATATANSTNTNNNNTNNTNTNMLDRYREWKTAHARLRGAKRVLILGGGAVGVELAAEIIDHNSNNNNNSNSNSNKRAGSGPIAVTIVDAKPTLVPLFPKSVGAYAEDWLTQRGAELRLGESLKSWNDRSCTLEDGTVLHADVLYVCFGNRPNSEPVHNSKSKSNNNNNNNSNGNGNGNALFSLTKRRTVEVRDTLQLVVVDSNDNNDNDNNDNNNDNSIETRLTSWFACGDVASPPTNDEKQAFQAEMQGKVAAWNAIRLLEADLSSSSSSNEHHQPERAASPRLLRYPRDIAGADRIPLVFVLSLGKHDGVLGFNNVCLPGPLAAVVKWILEYTKVSHMRGRLLGQLIWKLGDGVTLFLSRTLFRPPSTTTATATATTAPVGNSYRVPSSSSSSAATLQQRQLEQQLKLS